MYTKEETESAWVELNKRHLLTKEECEECRKAWDEYNHPDYLFPTGEFLHAWKIQQDKINDKTAGICEAVRLMTMEQGKRRRAEESAKTFDRLHLQACNKLSVLYSTIEELERQLDIQKEINKLTKQIEAMGLPNLSWSRARRTSYNAKRRTLCEHRDRICKILDDQNEAAKRTHEQLH